MRTLNAAMALWPGLALAQQAVTSAAPASVAVTIYREPGRAADAAFDRGWLRGYALVTETRDVDLPAGPATVRFEGVAAGMLAETALVRGLPAGVAEQNLDADLIGARNLYARSFGRPVIVRHTDPRSGAVVEEQAVIRSGPDGAAVIQTRDGFRSARCAWPDEYISYADLPAGLVAKPTLSVQTRAPAAMHGRVTLSYLAWGFDWRADYVLTMARDGRHLDLAAWITLASSDDTAFAGAAAAVVAGKPEKQTRGWENRFGDDQSLLFTCETALPPPPPPPPPPMVEFMAPAPVAAKEYIVVTAQRRAPVMAQQEALGDLKLYRLPLPTMIAPRAQKQMAFADRRAVKVQPFYKGTLQLDEHEDQPLRQALRLNNRKAAGLGLALPAGHVVVLEPHGATTLPVGEGRIDDKAVGEEIDIELGEATAVYLAEADGRQRDDARAHDHIAAVTNGRDQPVIVELAIPLGEGQRLTSPSHPLTRKNGQPLWRVTVPAHGIARLAFRVTDSA
ncbi:DUF4139 domain-containing protein [Novosphingobium sp. AAP1]|uniref:DUF4139 domain-containing protein n=1 Tax=Novosphingobium sp. AAP1 TaxID=1523413 RepID=UPI0009EC8BDD|nr:hypothetical protein [Novosphingobium sp. AAP1]